MAKSFPAVEAKRIRVLCPACHWIFEYANRPVIQCQYCRRQHCVDDLRALRPEIGGMLVEEPGTFRRRGTRTLPVEYYTGEDAREARRAW